MAEKRHGYVFSGKHMVIFTLQRNLVDIDSDGYIDERQFIVGLHTIDNFLRGIPVPKSLPQDLSRWMSAA